jgi:hypothetical protein
MHTELISHKEIRNRNRARALGYPNLVDPGFYDPRIEVEDHLLRPSGLFTLWTRLHEVRQHSVLDCFAVVLAFRAVGAFFYSAWDTVKGVVAPSMIPDFAFAHVA